MIIAVREKFGMRRRLALLLAMIIAALSLAGCSSINKNSRENMAAEVLITCSSSFKSPQSLRMVSGSGSLYRNDDGSIGGFLYARVSAKNGWGTDTTSRYVFFIGTDGEGFVLDEENFASFFSDNSKFTSTEIDVSVVNGIIADHWKQRGL